MTHPHPLNPRLKLIVILLAIILMACGGETDEEEDNDNRHPAGINGVRSQLDLSPRSLPTAPIFNHFQYLNMGQRV